MNKKKLLEEQKRMVHLAEYGSELNEGIVSDIGKIIAKVAWDQRKKVGEIILRTMSDPEVVEAIRGWIEDKLNFEKVAESPENIKKDVPVKESIQLEEGSGYLWKDFVKLVGLQSSVTTAAFIVDKYASQLDSRVMNKIYDLTKIELFKYDAIKSAANSSMASWWIKPLVAFTALALLANGILWIIERHKK